MKHYKFNAEFTEDCCSSNEWNEQTPIGEGKFLGWRVTSDNCLILKFKTPTPKGEEEFIVTDEGHLSCHYF